MKCRIYKTQNNCPNPAGFIAVRTRVAAFMLGCATLVTSPGTAAVFDFSSTAGPVGAAYEGGPVSGVVTLTYPGQPTTNIATGVTGDVTEHHGVVGWTSGARVYSYAFDPTRGRWVGIATDQSAGPISDLTSVDGVVSWSVPGGGVFYRVYDPGAGNWVGNNGPGLSGSSILSSEGVVAWSRGNTVYFSVYDPTRNGNGWQNRSVNINNQTFDLRNVDGIVAWSANSPSSPQVYRVEYHIYDPRQRQWMAGSANSAFTANLEIQNSVVSWTPTGGSRITRGYNPSAGSGAWQTAPVPLAYFAVSTNSGNAPLSISFVDMSIGGSSWSWNFGDGLGTSARRSPIYRYTTFGRFSAVLNVNGSNANLVILTDTVPPIGTNRINNGAGFTTNRTVALTLSAADNSGTVVTMRFSNEGTNWSDWEPFGASKTWTLSDGNGAKIVSAQFRDSASNTSANANASIYLDTNAPPVISLVNANVDESGGVATVLAVLDHPYPLPVSVSYATADGTALSGSDYLATNGVLRFASNITTASFSISIISDPQTEVNETILVLFSNATNGVAGPPGTITIHDDDPATVTFASTNFSAFENSGAATIHVALNAASGLPISVRYTATNGVAGPGIDFTPVEGVLSFAPGQTNQTFTIPLINESLDELSETVNLVLFGSTNAFLGFPASATLTILDDDNPVVFFTSSQYSISETVGVVRASVRLSKPFFEAVSVDYAIGGGTATPGEDYPGAVSGVTLLFQPGQTNKDISVTILNDTRPEYDETIHLTLSDFFNVGPGPTVEADILIDDDDGPPLMLSPTITPSQQFQVMFQGKPGQRFSVEASTNLPIWFPLVTLTNTTGTLLFNDPVPATNSHRFYRTLVTP